jgi:hypothetical protein
MITNDQNGLLVIRDHESGGWSSSVSVDCRAARPLRQCLLQQGARSWEGNPVQRSSSGRWPMSL